MKALSIRQPWAWLIVRPDIVGASSRQEALRERRMKPVENRTWETLYRGPLLLHAGSGMTHADYDACYLFLRADERLQHLCAELPAFDELERGGIVGRARIQACVRAHESPFFCGPFGWLLADVEPVRFTPLKGALGLFNVHNFKTE